MLLRSSSHQEPSSDSLGWRLCRRLSRRSRWSIVPSHGWACVLVAATITISPQGLTAPPASNPLWADINASIAMADYDLALALLAELAADSKQRGPALTKAAEVYIQKGNEAEATELLKQAAVLPGGADAANTLARLLYRKRAYADIVLLAQTQFATLWEEDVLLLIRNARLIEGEDLGSLPTDALAKGQADTISIAYAGNVYVSEYAPYSDDTSITDAELHSDLSIRLTYPWRDSLDLVGRLVLEDDQSMSSPESFHAYQTQSYGLHGGFRSEMPGDGTLRCEFGMTLIDKKHAADADIGGQETEWTYATSWTQPFREADISLGAYRSLFGSPTRDNYTTEKTDAAFVRAALCPHEQWEFSGRYTDIHYTGRLEDFGLLSGTVRYSPVSFPSLALSCGAERELRDDDENTLFLNVDGVLQLPGTNVLLASTGLYANVTTRERDVLLELILTKRAGGRRWALGLSGRHEINVNDRRSLQIFIRVQ